MIPMRVIAGACLAALIGACVQPAAGQYTVYKVILHGKIMMQDGSPPPHPLSVQRECSDVYGDAPGPLTNKKGEYIWQMDIMTMNSRACVLKTYLKGYSSNIVDISDLNGYLDTAQTLPPLILHPSGADPRVINEGDVDVPSGARPAWKTVLKELNGGGSVQEIAEQLKVVVAQAPKFARGWDSLGIAYETLGKSAEARDAYIKATQLDPKMTVAFVTLSREDVLAKDWQGAVDAANTVIRLDLKHMYPEVYLHLAVAQYEMNDLKSAEADARKSLELNAQERKYRGEFVLGQILVAKGDIAGAKQHIAKYLEFNKTPPDVDLIKNYLAALGTPDAASIHPDLETP